MSEISQWVAAGLFSLVVLGLAFKHLNTSDTRSPGDLMALVSKLGGVGFALLVSFVSLMAAAIID